MEVSETTCCVCGKKIRPRKFLRVGSHTRRYYCFRYSCCLRILWAAIRNRDEITGEKLEKRTKMQLLLFFAIPLYVIWIYICFQTTIELIF